MGVYHLETGATDSAMVYFNNALEIYPAYVEAHYNRGNLLSLEGNWSAAGDAYERVVWLNKGLHQAWFNLGLARHKLGNISAAVEAYGKALELRNGDVEIWLNLALAQRQLGEGGRALESLLKVCQLKPNWLQG
jgi:tetratricopeptide (TPR) repeat protein